MRSKKRNQEEMKKAKTENLRFEFLQIERGQILHFQKDRYESALVILSGMCRVFVGTEVFELKRTNVFDELPVTLYIPPRLPFSVKGLNPSEIGLCMGKAKKGGGVTLIGSDAVKCRTVGKGDYERTVCDIVDADIACQHLIVGETFNEPAKWSSFPPHKHDRDSLPHEAKMEEIYFFKVDPPVGFGFQRLYSYEPESDKAIVIKNNTVVSISSGYHPVCVMPCCRLYYLWFLWGEKRKLAPFEDPQLSDLIY